MASAKKIQWNAVASPREMIIWGALLAFVLFLGAKQFFTPISKQVETTQSQVLAKQMELEAYKKFLKGNNAAGKKSLEGMDLNRQAMAQKVKDIFSRVNMSPDVVVSELLSALTNPAYAKAALLEKFNFLSEKKQMGYSEMNLDLKLTGTYNGIAQYLGFVRQLPYLVRIDSIGIKNKDGENILSQVEISARAVLYVGEPKVIENLTQANSNSDMATELLLEITGAKAAYTPFSAQPREMTNWSLHELKLTSTMAGGVRPTALINGKVFTIGDEIADFKLVEVRQREVVLERGDVRHVLKIEEDETMGGEKSFITRSSESAPAAPPAAEENLAPSPQASEPSKLENNPSNENGVSHPENVGESGAEKKSEAKALNPFKNDLSSGSGAASSEGEAIPPEYTPEEWQKYKANPYGVFTPTPESPTEVGAQGEKGSGGSGPGTPARTKLDPNKVEDIEETPYEDLEEVLQAEVESWG